MRVNLTHRDFDKVSAILNSPNPNQTQLEHLFTKYTALYGGDFDASTWRRSSLVFYIVSATTAKIKEEDYDCPHSAFDCCFCYEAE